jgi:hypothetical protein
VSGHPGVPQMRPMRPRPRIDTRWQEHAACVDANPNIFFDPDRYTEALAVCARCPVQARLPCRELGRGQADGVWGGRIHQKYKGKASA